MIEEILVSVLGVIFLVVLFIYLINFLYRFKMAYLISDMSRDIQGVEKMPKLPLKNIIYLVNLMKTRKKEIEEHLKEEDDEDKYRNTYG